MPVTIIQSDSFTGGPGALGSNWANMMTAIRGDVNFDGTNNRITGAFSANGNDHPVARWVGPGSFTNNHASIIKLKGLTILSTTVRVGATGRQGAGTGAAATAYEGYIYVDGTGVYTTILALRNGASYTTLHSATVAWADDDDLSVECEDTTIRLCKNSTPLGGGFTVTDSTLATGQPGVIVTASAFGDDWRGGVITAPAGPTITTQPSNQTANEPASATFTGAATGVGTVTYQWQRAEPGSGTFANVSGAVAASYAKPSTAALADHGAQYRFVATDSNGSTTSAAATLTVNATTSTARPASDVSAGGWVPSTGGVLFDMVDEASASDVDYITSPALTSTAAPADMALQFPLAAGTWSIGLRARASVGAATVRVKLLDSSAAVVGTSADQALTGSFVTYALPITTSGVATRVRVEAVTP